MVASILSTILLPIGIFLFFAAVFGGDDGANRSKKSSGRNVTK
jgi:hypothetical protein